MRIGSHMNGGISALFYNIFQTARFHFLTGQDMPGCVHYTPEKRPLLDIRFTDALIVAQRTVRNKISVICKLSRLSYFLSA